MAQPLNVEYDWIAPSDVEAAYKIEVDGYPADEAASLDAFKYRQSEAGDLFLGAYFPGSPRVLIGYVCATLSPSPTLTHITMSTHVPSSASVCIHSVCVAPEHRHKGVASNLLKTYIAKLKERGKYARVLLITKEGMRGFYEKAGFEWLGISGVVHGKDKWHEMRIVFDNYAPQSNIASSDVPNTVEEAIALGSGTSTSEQETQMRANLWDALQRSTKRVRPTPKLFESYEGGLNDLLGSHEGKDDIPVNRFDILCPRTGCGSFILKKGVAEYVRRASVKMDPPHLPPQTLLAALPDPPEDADWWLIKPTPMQFENIGFSRPVQGVTQGGNGEFLANTFLPRRTGVLIGASMVPIPGHPLKLIACAECNLGPLGWSEEGGQEFWVACRRVGYRAE
ncbi:hypothetical protein C0993_010302 [Termitomyces sp. T159_Od127]|nr:hypothetical protein C0993_010302 [Termitomyces sp. T159_Od127]